MINKSYVVLFFFTFVYGAEDTRLTLLNGSQISWCEYEEIMERLMQFKDSRELLRDLRVIVDKYDTHLDRTSLNLAYYKKDQFVRAGLMELSGRLTLTTRLVISLSVPRPNFTIICPLRDEATYKMLLPTMREHQRHQQKRLVHKVMGAISSIKLHNELMFLDIADFVTGSQKDVKDATKDYLKKKSYDSLITPHGRTILHAALMQDIHQKWHIVDPSGQWKDDSLDDHLGWRNS